MNVYFCDVCGIRVTDVDLKGGHGMRRRHDVICATCLEMGHGKEWAEKAGLSGHKPAISVESAGKSSPAPVSVIDQARDRAATLEEAPAPAVQADRVQPIPTPVASMRTPAPVVAVSKSAIELDDDLVDPSPQAVKHKAETEPGLDIDDIPAAGGIASRRKEGSGRHKPSTGKTQKPSSGKTPRIDRSATNVRRDQQTSSSNSTTPGSATAVSGEQAKKPATGSTKRTKTAKSGRNKVQGIPPVIMVTIAGVLIIVLGGLTLMSSQGVFSSKETKSIDQKADLERMSLAIKDAKAAVNRDPHEATDAQVDQAIASIRSMQSALDSFSNSVKGYWTEAQIDTQLSSMGYSDVMGKLKMWNEEKAKRSQRLK